MIHLSPKDLHIVPIEESETIPSSWYTKQEIHDFEEEFLFRRTWQYIGHASQLCHPGDHVIGTAGNNPIIVVRNQEDNLRAFYNVCRHRAGPLALQNGCSSMLQCKYHGWTYTLDGLLRGTPRFQRTDLFDAKDFGLVPVQHAQWNNLVFVSLETPTETLDSFFNEVSSRLGEQHFDSLKFSQRVVYEVGCNWKVYVDNYLEGYHLPYVHPELCDLLVVQQYRTETFEHSSLQTSPLTSEKNLYSTKGGTAFYFHLFPNLMLNILPGRLQVNVVLPTSRCTCKVIFDYYYEDISSPPARQRIANDVSYSDKVQQEDIQICEHVQRGLASEAYDTGRFSPEMEVAVYHFQKMLKRAFANGIKQNSDTHTRA